MGFVGIMEKERGVEKGWLLGKNGKTKRRERKRLVLSK